VIGKERLDLTAEERDKIEEKMVGHGLTDVPLTEMNKEKAINDLLKAEVVITRVVAMDAMFRGLNCLGLGKLLRSYPTLIAPIVFPDESQVDPNVIKQKFERGTQGCDSEQKERAREWFFKFIDESANLEGN